MRASNDGALLVSTGAGAVALWWWLGRRTDARPARRTQLLDFGRPVPANVRAIVTSGWSRPRRDHVHHALDISLPIGTPVLSIADGRVVRVQLDPRGRAGIWVGVLHPSGVVSRYLHLSRAAVTRGEYVARGDVLGRSGNTGDSAGPHLHLDLRVPEYMLPTIAAAIGTPRDGWGSPLPPYGYSIPGEALIPVDGYREDVRRDARAAGVQLHEEVRHG